MKYQVLILFLLVVGCGTPPKQPNPKTGCLQSPCLITFGDSITAGYGAQVSYSQRLANKLGLPLLNQGSPGLKLTDPLALAIINSTIIGPYDTVTMMTCYNDARSHGDDPAYLTKFQAAAQAAISAIEAQHPKALYVAGCIAHSPTSADLDVLNVAQNYSVLISPQVSSTQYIDITNQFDSTNPNYWLNSDQIHPNDAGAEAIANIFYNAI